MASSRSTKFVRLVSRDGVAFMLPLSAAERSGTLKELFSDLAVGSTRLPEVGSTNLRWLVGVLRAGRVDRDDVGRMSLTRLLSLSKDAVYLQMEFLIPEFCRAVARSVPPDPAALRRALTTRSAGIMTMTRRAPDDATRAAIYGLLSHCGNNFSPQVIATLVAATGDFQEFIDFDTSSPRFLVSVGLGDLLAANIARLSPEKTEMAFSAFQDLARPRLAEGSGEPTLAGAYQNAVEEGKASGEWVFTRLLVALARRSAVETSFLGGADFELQGKSWLRLAHAAAGGEIGEGTDLLPGDFLPFVFFSALRRENFTLADEIADEYEISWDELSVCPLSVLFISGSLDAVRRLMDMCDDPRLFLLTPLPASKYDEIRAELTPFESALISRNLEVAVWMEDTFHFRREEIVGSISQNFDYVQSSDLKFGPVEKLWLLSEFSELPLYREFRQFRTSAGLRRAVQRFLPQFPTEGLTLEIILAAIREDFDMLMWLLSEAPGVALTEKQPRLNSDRSSVFAQLREEKNSGKTEPSGACASSCGAERATPFVRERALPRELVDLCVKPHHDAVLRWMTEHVFANDRKLSANAFLLALSSNNPDGAKLIDSVISLREDDFGPSPEARFGETLLKLAALTEGPLLARELVGVFNVGSLAYLARRFNLSRQVFVGDCDFNPHPGKPKASGCGSSENGKARSSRTSPGAKQSLVRRTQSEATEPPCTVEPGMFEIPRAVDMRNSPFAEACQYENVEMLVWLQDTFKFTAEEVFGAGVGPEQFLADAKRKRSFGMRGRLAELYFRAAARHAGEIAKILKTEQPPFVRLWLRDTFE